MSMAGGADVYKALLILAESLIAGGFAYFFAISMHAMQEGNVPTLTAQQQAGLVVTGSVVLMALSAVQFAGISPGRIAAVVLVLLLARCGKEQGGAIAGVVLGVAMAMASPDHLVLAAAYAFGGLMAGIFSRFGRFAGAGGFLVSNIIVYMITASDLTVVVSIYEVLAGSVLFVVLPRSVDKTINRFFVRGRDIPAGGGPAPFHGDAPGRRLQGHGRGRLHRRFGFQKAGGAQCAGSRIGVPGRVGQRLPGLRPADVLLGKLLFGHHVLPERPDPHPAGKGTR